MSETYLVHYGIKGQKWYERRFQNPDGSLTAAGRIRYGVVQAARKVSSGARIVVNKSKQKYKTVQEEHKEKQEQRAEEDKQSIIRSADAKRILDNQDKLTTQELNDALNRVRSVTALNDQVSKDKKAAEDAANYNKKSHKIGRGIAKLADFSLNTVNTVQKFVDAGKKISKWFNDEDNMPNLNEMTLDDALKKLDKLKVNDLKSVLVAKNAKESILGNANNKSPKPAPNDDGGKKKDDPPTTVDPAPKPETKPTGGSEAKETTKEETKTEPARKPAFTVSNSRSTLINENRNAEISSERKDEAWSNIQSIYDKLNKQKVYYEHKQASKTFDERIDNDAVDLGKERLKSLWGSELFHREEFKIDVIEHGSTDILRAIPRCRTQR